MTFMCNVKLNILYEDKAITVLEKPVGVLSEDAQNGDMGLVGILSEYAGKPVHLLHRLDRNVGGVMVFANNKQSAGALSKDIAEGRFFKEYMAVCEGNIENFDEVTLIDYLEKDEKNNKSFISKNGKEAVLDYEVVKYNEEINTLKDIILR